MMDFLKLFLNPLTLCREYFTFWSGGGGGGSQTSTSYSTNLPEYAKPFYQELLKRTGMAVYDTDASGNVTGVKPAPVYAGLSPEKQKQLTDVATGRVAGFEPEQEAIQQRVLGLQTPTGFAEAGAGATTAQNIGYGSGLTGLSTALGYTPGAITPQQVTADEFTGAAADRYMSPYQQRVIDITKREAQRAADIKRARGTMGAISRGTFGGARQALMQAEEDRGTAQLLSDIQAKGSQAAFENAQATFEKDSARRMQAAQLNQATDMQAQQLLQQAMQFRASTGKDIGIAGLQQGLEASKAKAAISAQERTAELETLKAQAATAEEKQQLQQQINDIKYQTFMEQNNFERSMLEYYSNILRGNAAALGSTQVQYSPGPSMLSQVGGLGLAGLGLYNVLGKQG